MRDRRSISKKVVVLVAFITTAFFINGCSSSEDTASSSTTTGRIYAGAGSDWRWILKDDGTFMGLESETPAAVQGTYTTTSTGFLKATVTGSTGTGAPAAGTILSGVEVPGFSLLWSPILSSETNIQGNIQGGICPTHTTTFSYLYMQFSASVDLTDNSQREYFGVFQWNPSGSGEGTAIQKFGLANNYEDLTNKFTSPAITGNCANGLLSTTSFNAYLAPASLFVKVTENASPTKGDGMIAMPQTILTSLASFDGIYRGFVYDDAAPTAKTKSVIANVSTGSISVKSVSPTDLITVNGDIDVTLNLTAINSPVAGFIKGDLGGSSIICAASLNVAGSGKNALYCLGQNPSDAKKPLVLVISSL